MKNTTLYVGDDSYEISVNILSLMNSLVKENQYEWKLRDSDNNIVYSSSTIKGTELRRKLFVYNTRTDEMEMYTYRTIENDKVIID